MFGELIGRIKLIAQEKKSGLVGFDGFVDEIVHVVDKRIDEGHYERICHIEEYGERIRKSAGLSTNIEMVTVQKKLGGNGPIFSGSLMELGVDILYIGALGYPQLDGIFEQIQRGHNLISIANPGHTDAVEFLDGKIISSKLEPLKEVSWDTLTRAVDPGRLKEQIEHAEFCAFLNWTMLIHMNDIWGHLIQEILPEVSQKRERRLLFIDLADPQKRSGKDIVLALQTLEQFQQYFQVVLSLNKKEACEVAGILGLGIPDYNRMELSGLARFLRTKIQVHTIVIHSVREVCGTDGRELKNISGPYCETPLLTTGSGDNFNAGFVYGQIHGFSLEDSLYLGVANSGFYVRKGRSPSTEELICFLEAWAQGVIK